MTAIHFSTLCSENAWFHNTEGKQQIQSGKQFFFWDPLEFREDQIVNRKYAAGKNYAEAILYFKACWPYFERSKFQRSVCRIAPLKKVSSG